MRRRQPPAAVRVALVVKHPERVGHALVEIAVGKTEIVERPQDGETPAPGIGQAQEARVDRPAGAARLVEVVFEDERLARSLRVP